MTELQTKGEYHLIIVLRGYNLLNYLVIPVTGFSASTKAVKIQNQFS